MFVFGLLYDFVLCLSFPLEIEIDSYAYQMYPVVKLFSNFQFQILVNKLFHFRIGHEKPVKCKSNVLLLV